MRILLTGASGFVGKALLPLLEHHDLLVISRKSCQPQPSHFSYVQGDLSVPVQWENIVKEFSPEGCIHLAWDGLPDYSFSQCLNNFFNSF